MACRSPLRPILILGPTAGGKSELAINLAEHLRGEVISADSMQIYRHMDAGTAKPSAALRRRAVHHLIDIVEPTGRFTVADWLARAEPLIDRLAAAHVRPIVVGGTNLYINALLEGLFDGPPAEPAFRQSLASISPPDLHAKLIRIDPAAAARIDRNDRKRLVRALEVHHLTGRRLSDLQQQWDVHRQPPYRRDPLILGLAWPAQALNSRINLRVKAMFHPDIVDPAAAGEIRPGGESLPQETARLQAADLLGPQARQALGYKQVLEHLAGRGCLDDAFEQTKIQTRRFAKQQRTWLKRFRGVYWLDAADRPAGDLAQAACDIIATAPPHP